jgi:hypothetical protein
MKLKLNKIRIGGMTLAETAVAMGIGTSILAAFTWASVALQKSFMAIEDYAKGQNDQMRISDYLSLDMRRALSISITGTCQAPPLVVTLTIPNVYDANGKKYLPSVTSQTGWPYKKHHHNKHQNIILNQVVDYGKINYQGATVANPATTTTITYTLDSSNFYLYRSVNGVSKIIARDVKDFCVQVSDLDETAQTSITFQPRFTNLAAANANGVSGTTYFQTTLTRNTR